MPKLLKNVKCIEWTNHLSILCHQHVRLFITHGGFLGTQEAVYCGVPILWHTPVWGSALEHGLLREKGASSAAALPATFIRTTIKRFE
ncbi:UDP-glycosyltransferase UGT5 [Anthophora quadrimaculata]